MTTQKPIDIDRLESLLGVTLEQWQRVYLDRAFGDEARGMAGAHLLTREKQYEYDLGRLIQSKFIPRYEIEKAINADRAKQHARDALVVGLLVGVMLGALVMGAILWAVA